MRSIKEKFSKIKCLAMDVDGVMTDGHIWLHENGEWRRNFYIRDGLGLLQLKARGVELAVITTSQAEDIRARMKNLKIIHFYEGAHDKLSAFQDLMKKTQLSAKEIAFIGDDVLDLPVLKVCGLAIAPQDAHPDVKKSVHFTTKAAGGKGAVRELCDLLIKAQK